ncbi:flagellar protein FliT [Brevibacillus nitrificans]|uniref:Flagellar protein FliT n=1 Tax=Brevibacillus nitrificans TaxID=651560 RepID=A0A3M8DRI8_9BACL|nr:flagellar protein FliT [Brevibacillus nitrificans]RNB90099.1 flagellar protein FliT [Brevibacillus nitrificans]
MESTVDYLMEALYEKTHYLVQLVEAEGSDSMQWLPVLEDRENIIRDLDNLIQKEGPLSGAHKQQLAVMNEMNQKILSQMSIRKEKIAEKLSAIQQKKAAKQFYNQMGPSGYGAFFDRKK